MVGLDASGRTTALYKLKLGEVVTTIPTIGFNVETIDYRGMSFTFWDVGGCDKIRPLWRHYYQNTQGLIFFIDSNDRDRIESARDEFYRMLAEDELRDVIVLVFANKQDLPTAMTSEEVAVTLGTDTIRNKVFVQGSCATSGDGLYEGLDWLVRTLEHSGSDDKSIQQKRDNPDTPDTSLQKAAKTPEEIEGDRMEALLLEWLEREDEDDELFLRKLEAATLDTWDHYTHLRIAWLYLTKLGRRDGMAKIFESIKSFIERSPRTKRGDTSRGIILSAV